MPELQAVIGHGVESSWEVVVRGTVAIVHATGGGLGARASKWLLM